MLFFNEINNDNKAKVQEFIEGNWGSTLMVSKGKTHDAGQLPGYIVTKDEEIVAMITYHLEEDQCEIVSLDSYYENQGIGTCLVKKVVDVAKEHGCRRVWLITTNDNTPAMKFYQERGFDMSGIHHDAANKARLIKPEIPLQGMDGIPIRHEIEFEMHLNERCEAGIRHIEVPDLKHWPGSRFEAEVSAYEAKCQTLLCITDGDKMCGRSFEGVWCMCMPYDLQDAFNLTNYENEHGRKVMIWSKSPNSALELKARIRACKEIQGSLQNLPDHVCHSTTIENFHKAMKEGKLTCPKEFSYSKRNENAARYSLKEPLDYLDYVELCDASCLDSEIYVSSMKCGRIDKNPNQTYEPGVRIYFSTKLLLKEKNICFDGFNTMKFHKELPLDLAEAFIFSSRESLESFLAACENVNEDGLSKFKCVESDEPWTPASFVNACCKAVGTEGWAQYDAVKQPK